jgi:hypothetical protein
MCIIQPRGSSPASQVDSPVMKAASSSSSSADMPFLAVHPELIPPAPLASPQPGRLSPISADVPLTSDMNPTFATNVMSELSFTPTYSPLPGVHDQKEVGGWDDPTPAASSPPSTLVPSELIEQVKAVSRGNSLPTGVHTTPFSAGWDLASTSHAIQNPVQMNRELSMFSSVASITSQTFEVGSSADHSDQMKEMSSPYRATDDGHQMIMRSSGPSSSDIQIKVQAGAAAGAAAGADESTLGSTLKRQQAPLSPKPAAVKSSSAFSYSSLPSAAATAVAAKVRGSISKLGAGLSTAPISASPSAAAAAFEEVRQQRVSQPGFITASEAARYLLKGRGGASSSLRAERRSLTGGQASPSASLSRGGSINSATGGVTAPTSPSARSRASSRAASPKQRRKTETEADLITTSSGVLPPEAGIR